MQRNEWVIVIAFFIGAIVFVFIQSRRDIKVDGGVVFAKTPQSVTTLKVSGDFISRNYLVVGMGLSPTDYFQAELPVIPEMVVESLTREYGDFRHCASTGAEAGKQSVVQLRMVGINDTINQKIKAAYRQSRQLRDFTIRLQEAPLDIVTRQTRSNRGRWLSAQPHQDVLVKDVEIISNK